MTPAPGERFPERWIGVKRMLKSDLIAQTWSRHRDLYKSDVSLLVDLLFETVAEALEQGEAVEIRGFGRLTVVTHKPRCVRNPRTGEQWNQPERRRIHFKAGKEIRERINR